MRISIKAIAIIASWAFIASDGFFVLLSVPVAISCQLKAFIATEAFAFSVGIGGLLVLAMFVLAGGIVIRPVLNGPRPAVERWA